MTNKKLNTTIAVYLKNNLSSSQNIFGVPKIICNFGTLIDASAILL